MTVCNDCWDEAFRRSQIGGGHQAEHYEALLLVPVTERTWCGFAQRNGFVTQPASLADVDDAWDDEPQDCYHDWLDRPESDTHVCLMCGEENSGPPPAEGCDCTELCEMGPTCPGGMLARLPGSGCYRTRPTPPARTAPAPCATCTDPAELTDCRSDTGEQCGPCHVADCAECQDVMADEDAASARTDGRAP